MNKIDLSAIKKRNPYQKEKGSSDNSILAALNKDITFFKKKVLNDKKKERFYSDLNLLLESGVDLKTALELFIEEQKNEKEKELYVKISKAIVGGLTLSESLQNENEFSLYEVYSIKIGEESGSLNKVLKDLSVFFTNKITQQRKLVNAFSYPVMVLGVAFCVIAFMLNFVVPMFSDVFKRLNGELPAITVFVINMSTWFSSNFWYFILLIIAIITFVVYNKNKEWYRKFSSQLLLKTPLFGSIYEQIYLARFCSSMSLLLGAKTPLISCLDLVEKMIGFYPIEKSVHELRQEIYKGTSLSTAMKKHKIYNSRMISLIKVGEEVNQLDTIFTKLSAQLTTEAEQKTSLLSSLIEPIMIIFIGVFVAVILISMYLPLFKISTTVF